MRVMVDIPDQVIDGRTADELARDMSQLAVLEAYRSGRISSGRTLCELEPPSGIQSDVLHRGEHALRHHEHGATKPPKGRRHEPVAIRAWS